LDRWKKQKKLGFGFEFLHKIRPRVKNEEKSGVQIVSIRELKRPKITS